MYSLTATKTTNLDNIYQVGGNELTEITSGQVVSCSDAEYLALERAGLIIGTSLENTAKSCWTAVYQGGSGGGGGGGGAVDSVIAADTKSIDMTVSPTTGNVIVSAAVKVSPAIGNTLTIDNDGLFVPTSGSGVVEHDFISSDTALTAATIGSSLILQIASLVPVNVEPAVNDVILDSTLTVAAIVSLVNTTDKTVTVKVYAKNSGGGGGGGGIPEPAANGKTYGRKNKPNEGADWEEVVQRVSEHGQGALNYKGTISNIDEQGGDDAVTLELENHDIKSTVQLTDEGIKTSFTHPSSTTTQTISAVVNEEGFKVSGGDITTDNDKLSEKLNDAAKDGKTYGRNNGAWVEVVSGTGGIPEAPTDGKQYGRQSSAWTEVVAGIEEAPSNNKTYARKNEEWTVIDAPDPKYNKGVTPFTPDQSMDDGVYVDDIRIFGNTGGATLVGLETRRYRVFDIVDMSQNTVGYIDYTPSDANRGIWSIKDDRESVKANFLTTYTDGSASYPNSAVNPSITTPYAIYDFNTVLGLDKSTMLHLVRGGEFMTTAAIRTYVTENFMFGGTVTLLDSEIKATTKRTSFNSRDAKEITARLSTRPDLMERYSDQRVQCLVSETSGDLLMLDLDILTSKLTYNSTGEIRIPHMGIVMVGNSTEMINGEVIIRKASGSTTNGAIDIKITVGNSGETSLSGVSIMATQEVAEFYPDKVGTQLI